MSLLLTITLLLPQFHTGLSHMSLLNDGAARHASTLLVKSRKMVKTPEAFFRNISVCSDLINLCVLAATRAPFELQTHYTAMAYFAMKFNSLIAYY